MSAYRNIMEEIVLANLDKVISETGCCNCEMCRSDVITYTLNRLPPKYVTTRKGELFSLLEAQFFQNAADIIFAMSKSAKQIKENPNPECERIKAAE
ncbi:MAG: late competence development ComFB family protein [Oscillospiraceae bacterium]|nr:late competence development ComFB family protein [Oscillospiraceae bacterium]